MRWRQSLGLVLALPLVLAGCGGDGRAELRVFAAASLVDVFAELEELFEAENPGIDVVIQPGGSTQLATQIGEGAPADVFASANEAAMALVTDDPAGFFATNQLVIATPPGNPGEVSGLDDLARGELVVAVCDPVVPCGQLAADVLADAAVAISPDSEEPNVRAVLNKVVLDEVDAGLVYRSDALAAASGVVTIEIDSDRVNAYPVDDLDQQGAASDFVDLVLSDRASAIFEEAGFGAP